MNNNIPASRPRKRSFLARAKGYVHRTIYSRVRRKYLRHKWRENYCAARLDWDWRAVNYNRISVVNLLMGNKPGCDYLEIGCGNNQLFDSVLSKRKIGVDPATGGTHRQTSDEFFANNSQTFDVVFIDGLHTYEQVRRDVINSLKFLKRGGWIALHDMIPRNWLEEHIPLISDGDWTGDVWKIAFELAQSKDVDFRLLKIDHGVGVLRALKDNPQIVDMQQDLRPKRFSYFYENMSTLPIVEYDAGRNWIEQNLPS